jgi:hypothetical protein
MKNFVGRLGRAAGLDESGVVMQVDRDVGRERSGGIWVGAELEGGELAPSGDAFLFAGRSVDVEHRYFDESAGGVGEVAALRNFEASAVRTGGATVKAIASPGCAAA